MNCEASRRRTTMTDAEFWEDVARSIDVLPGDPLDLDELDPPMGTPCSECGSTGACGYDSEGRPMIHVQEDDANG